MILKKNILERLLHPSVLSGFLISLSWMLGNSTGETFLRIKIPITQIELINLSLLFAGIFLFCNSKNANQKLNKKNISKNNSIILGILFYLFVFSTDIFRSCQNYIFQEKILKIIILLSFTLFSNTQFGKKHVLCQAWSLFLLYLVWAITYLVWEILRVFENPYLDKNIPFGSYFSFIRLGIVGTLCGLIVFANKPKIKVIILLLSYFLFFCTESKAAWVVCVGVTFIFSVLNFSVKNIKKIAAINLVCFVSFCIYLVIPNSKIKTRFETVISAKGYTLSLDETIKNTKNQIDTGALIACQYLTGQSENYLNKFSKDTESVLRNIKARYCIIPDLSDRFRLFHEALEGIKEKPIFGNGFNNFKYKNINLYTKTKEIYNYPHNLLLEILYSSGFIGGLFLIGIVLLILKRIFLIGQSNCYIIFIGVSMLILHSFVSGSITDFALFFLLPTFATILNKNEKVV